MQYRNRKNIEPRALGKRWAAVEVRQVSGRVYKIVPGSLCTLDPVTMVIERPDLKIIDENGEEMQPTGTFFWTAETFDPAHLVVDLYEVE
ncbi:hypothetical protein [Eubacterium sp. An3]|uniref:hypothetical protein n=1 Tax=Eubacterium sp. An3 TaxID=1965628 RepID=UPI000B383AA4|nr:hypothetical protein [Eubacterium sp. An3]OUO26548.1 hypothetical protein B5F87_13560 [Eubacterium sp. An3]